jgi:hypothetical protein
MMFFRFTHEYRDAGVYLAQIEMRAEIFGEHDEWFVGEIAAEDLDTREWTPLENGSRLRGAIFRRLVQDQAMRSRIGIEFTRHCIAHGGDGLLDVAERALDHKREEAVA